MTVKVRILRQLVTAPVGGMPLSFEPGTVAEWPASDVDRLCAAGLAERMPDEPKPEAPKPGAKK